MEEQKLIERYAIFIVGQKELNLYSNGHATEKEAMDRLLNANTGNAYVVLPYYTLIPVTYK